MLDLEKVQTLNELEMLIYHYVLEHLHQIPQRTIRQLVTLCRVSTLAILRLCSRMDYAGFSELKYAMKEEAKQAQMFENFYDATVHVDAFLKKSNQETYHEVLRPAIQMIIQAHHVAFTNIGTSGISGNYGSRYSANLNINSCGVTDPLTPIPKRGFENTLALILSVPGETNEMIKQMTDFKTADAGVLGITNSQRSTIARLTDCNISYYMLGEHFPFVDKSVNTATQIPVTALIEPLAHQASQPLKELDETPFWLFFTKAHTA